MALQPPRHALGRRRARRMDLRVAAPRVPDRAPSAGSTGGSSAAGSARPTPSSASPSRPRRTCAGAGSPSPLLVPNGWDPESAPAARRRPPACSTPTGVSLVYTGRFGSYGRDPRALVDGARAARARSDRDAAAKLELVIAGPLTEDEAALFDDRRRARPDRPRRQPRARARPGPAARGRRAAARRPADPLAAAQHQALRVPGRRRADPRPGGGNGGRADRRRARRRGGRGRRPGGDRRGAGPGRAPASSPLRHPDAVGAYTYPAPAEGMAAAVEAAISAPARAMIASATTAAVAGTWSR